jgi:hypothetical protein
MGEMAFVRPAADKQIYLLVSPLHRLLNEADPNWSHGFHVPKALPTPIPSARSQPTGASPGTSEISVSQFVEMVPSRCRYDNDFSL